MTIDQKAIYKWMLIQSKDTIEGYIAADKESGQFDRLSLRSEMVGRIYILAEFALFLKEQESLYAQRN